MAVAAALARKALDLRVLALGRVSDFTDLFLIASGANERQVQAIADSIQRDLRDVGVRPLHVEGHRHGRWILMDYGGDMVIHVFHREARQFYALERLWSDAPDLTDVFVDGESARSRDEVAASAEIDAAQQPEPLPAASTEAETTVEDEGLVAEDPVVEDPVVDNPVAEDSSPSAIRSTD